MTSVTFNNLSKADGSALIDQDDTIVQASVFGPVDVPLSKINYDEAVVDILFKPKISVPVNHPGMERIREIENLLRCVFKEVILTKLHPRTAVNILIQEIYDGGSLLSASINAACCALIDAGIPMKCPIVGISTELVNHQDQKCSFQFVFDSNLDIITLMTRGCVDKAGLFDAIETGRTEARKHLDNIRVKIKERFI